ncbi:MAG TPA: alpha/beta fold hydrolase [Tepidisphaeraceae bacterium]|jgi:pimeloyl-ACP methyl ester carboxylesterase|nr:alpha/beta fold hydrolase [Tepidisphaeraceae bacterium]
MPPTSPANKFSWHFADRGSGVPVVLVHAFPLNHSMWAEQVDLGRGIRVLTPDLPGFGKTPLANEAFTIPAVAEALHEQLAERKALPCVLGGCSMGGYVSLAFARAFPRDLRGLVLIDTRAEADTADAKKNRDKSISLVRTAGSAAIADQMIGKLLSTGTVAHRPALVNHVRQMIESAPPATIAAALGALRDRPDQTDLLPSISAPTMVIVGEHDTLTPPAISQAMASAIPHALLRIISSAGHLSPMEQPAQVNAALAELLAVIPR